MLIPEENVMGPINSVPLKQPLLPTVLFSLILGVINWIFFLLGDFIPKSFLTILETDRLEISMTIFVKDRRDFFEFVSGSPFWPKEW